MICLLLYGGYLMLRRAIDEPTQRARLSAVLSIFLSLDIVIVWKSIEWWRTQHPAPVLSIRNGGGMAPGMEAPIYWNLLALMMLAAALVLIRMRQEDMQREIDALAPLRARHVRRTTAMDARNFQFMFYGFTAAWLIIAVYVISIAARERKLRNELDRVKRMIEQGEKEYRK